MSRSYCLRLFSIARIAAPPGKTGLGSQFHLATSTWAAGTAVGFAGSVRCWGASIVLGVGGGEYICASGRGENARRAVARGGRFMDSSRGFWWRGGVYLSRVGERRNSERGGLPPDRKDG